MIQIRQSPTADTRTCDFKNVSKATLLASSVQHIADVAQALAFFASRILQQAVAHDTDKLTDIDGFHADFVTGFAQTGWWDRHRMLNRHHLLQPDGTPHDVNLIDVLDLIADCVMAGMARNGSVYEIKLDDAVLQRAFANTVELLKAQVKVATGNPDPHAPECNAFTPPWFKGHWRDWHRGHGCKLDDLQPRSKAGAEEIARGGQPHEAT